jgi:hypothetical protein
VPKLAAYLTLMVLVGIIKITRTTTTIIAATTMAPLKTTTSLLLGATTTTNTCSSIGQHMILLLLLPLRFLHDETCFSVLEEARVECLGTDRLGHTIDLLNQGVVVTVETIQNI